MYIVQVGQRKWTVPEKNGLASIKYCLDWRCLLCNSLFLHLINGKLCCICGYVIVPDRRIAQLVRVSDSYIQQCLKKVGNFCFSLRHLLLVKTSFSWSQRTCLSCFSSVRPPQGIITTSILCLVLLLAAVVPFVRSYPCTCRGSSGKPLLILVFCGCMYG